MTNQLSDLNLTGATVKEVLDRLPEAMFLHHFDTELPTDVLVTIVGHDVQAAVELASERGFTVLCAEPHHSS